MSSVPPNPPAGGNPPGGFPPGSYPPQYDPHGQWRVYREQQKAAWRAQRDAWRAQRYAWKANYWKAYGPRVPSVVGPIILVAIGIIWLLIYSGHLAAMDFWRWYGRWWPVVLIVAGLALLGEWALDLRRATPVRRGGSFVGVLILVAFIGLIAAGANHMGPFIGHWNNGDNGDFFNMFNMPEHDLDQPVINQQIPANASIEIENPRGDVSVSAGDGTEIQVVAHEVAFANSDDEARKIFDAEKAGISVNGSTVRVNTQQNDKGRVNLAITIPKSARLSINSWNDVTASGLGAGINVSARGDIRLDSITGPISAHFVRGRHDEFSAHLVQGDIQLEGDCNDLTLSEIKGRVTQNGELLGDVHFENVSGGVHLKTTRTEIEIPSLPGDLTLNSDDLRINEPVGAVHVSTHAKDIDLSQVYGDAYVQNHDGSISIEPAGAYSIEAHNNKGDVEITLPPNASGTVNGRAHNGDIVSDYALSVSGDQDKTVTGKIGSGTAHIDLSADNGDVRIKKGPAFPATPPPPSTTAGVPAPPPPPPPNARRLKAPKAPPAPPVAQ